MKKVLLFFALILCGNIANAYQPPYAVYHSIEEERAAENTPAQMIYAYVNTSDGWVRMTIRVRQTNRSILVVAYKEKDTSAYSGLFAGSGETWRNCSVWAERVNAADGQVILNNFDYKAYISGLGRYIYF